MRQQTTWQKALLLTVFGAAIASACVVSSDDDGIDDEDGGTSNIGGKAGSTAGGKGGSTSTAGSAGTTNVGGETGDAGDTGTGGASGGAPNAMEPTCDPVDDMVVGTPQPNCEPTDANDDCQVCIQENCCEEYKNCNGYEPYNVCGWGGPGDWPSSGGEFLCWQACINAAYDESGMGGAGGTTDVLDEQLSQECLFTCATPACGAIFGDETNDLSTCVFNSCDTVCFE